VSSPIPTLREYGEYLESLDRPLDINVLLVGERRPGRNRAAAPEAQFEDAACDLDTLGPVGQEAMVADLGTSPGQRTRRRRWPVVATVAAAVVLVAGTVLVTRSGGHNVRIVPPAAPPTTATPVAPDPSLDSVLPPEGATPSTPDTGELVAAISIGEGASLINLYADGRVISFPAPDVPGRIAERRLSADGVERVRSAFLGVFLAGPTFADIWYSCACEIRVHDGARLLSIERPTSFEPTEVDPQMESEVDRLLWLVTHLESSLPASAWQDREIRAYVASKYHVCVWKETPNPQGDPHAQAVPDRSDVLARFLPARLVELLDAQGWVHTPGADCLELGLADARVLAESLTNQGVPHDYYSPGFIFRHWIGDPFSNKSRSAWQIFIQLKTFLPDGIWW
jgi:hypothetical protein